MSFDVVTRIVRPPKLRNADLVAEIMAHEHSEVVGAAYFRILVGPEGWVRSVKDRRASEPEPRRVARQLIDQLRFWPAYRGSKPVGRWVNLTFQFDGPRSRVSMESPDG